MSERVTICGGGGALVTGPALTAVSRNWGMDAEDSLFFLINGERMTILRDSLSSEYLASIGLGPGMGVGLCCVPVVTSSEDAAGLVPILGADEP